jgi:hypothetical protein
MHSNLSTSDSHDRTLGTSGLCRLKGGSTPNDEAVGYPVRYADLS